MDSDNLIRPPFETKYLTEEKGEVYGETEIISLKINAGEREKLEILKSYLQQPKDSTLLKQVMEIYFAEVILLRKNDKFREIILDNVRRNKRTGHTEFEKITTDSMQK
jgi:hypothetical protein